MSSSKRFSTGYLHTVESRREEVFLSVTPDFELGPGIDRDGISLPHMSDPHTVDYVTGGRGCGSQAQQEYPDTTAAYVQRAGTWTLFHHVKDFCDRYGAKYRVLGVQSCGDLTMNPWHVALIWRGNRTLLCRVAIAGRGYQEPYWERTYRCLVKWKGHSALPLHEFIDLKFFEEPPGFAARIVDDTYLASQANQKRLKTLKIDAANIAPQIEFALAGKPIIQKGYDIELANTIDRFQDVRHVFRVPTVEAKGMLRGVSVASLNFGEYTLYTDLNARRAALHVPLIINFDLSVPGCGVRVQWEDLKNVLRNTCNYQETTQSPTRRGEFRKYSQQAAEIFYTRNVFPFGAIGGKPGELVGLSCGGLSGRVGTTLDAITRIMYDFFGCKEAMIVDEGYDTFQVINPSVQQDADDADQYAYENQDMLKKIAAFTRSRAEEDHRESLNNHYVESGGLKQWTLNKRLFNLLEEFCEKEKVTAEPRLDWRDVMAVEPHRCQMRAVLIFAVRRDLKSTSRSRAAKAEQATRGQ